MMVMARTSRVTRQHVNYGLISLRDGCIGGYVGDSITD